MKRLSAPVLENLAKVGYCGDAGDQVDQEVMSMAAELLEWRAMPSGIEAEVCRDIKRRQQVGLVKYGVTLAENPLSLLEWLRHAYYECLDQALYLKRAMAELERRCGDDAR